MQMRLMQIMTTHLLRDANVARSNERDMLAFESQKVRCHVAQAAVNICSYCNRHYQDDTIIDELQGCEKSSMQDHATFSK